MEIRRRTAWVVIVVGVLTILAVLAISMWAAGRSSEGFPAWLEATSTFAAFTAASVAVFFAMRAQQIEAKRDRRIESSLVREQASKVAAWWGPGTREVPYLRGGSEIRVERTQILGVLMRNASDLPVSAVLIALTNGFKLLFVFRVGLLPPASDPKFESMSSDALKALEQEAINTTPGDPSDPDWEPNLGIDPDIALAFIDSAGLGWVRGPTGRLEEVTPEIVRDPSHGDLWGHVGLRGGG